MVASESKQILMGPVRLMHKNTRILIADDHDLIRKGLRSLLESRPGWSVCAECKNGREAVVQCEELRPDVAVLDITMPDLNGVEAAKQIQKSAPGTEILLLSIHYTDQLAREIVMSGVRGYVLKSDGDSDVIAAVENLSQHKAYFTALAMGVLLGGHTEPKIPSEKGNDGAREHLTAREREIVQLISEGKSSKEIAVELGLSVKTAETHRANIMRKLNVHTVQELVRYAVRNKIIEP